MEKIVILCECTGIIMFKYYLKLKLRAAYIAFGTNLQACGGS